MVVNLGTDLGFSLPKGRCMNVWGCWVGFAEQNLFQVWPSCALCEHQFLLALQTVYSFQQEPTCIRELQLPFAVSGVGSYMWGA